MTSMWRMGQVGLRALAGVPGQEDQDERDPQHRPLDEPKETAIGPPVVLDSTPVAVPTSKAPCSAMVVNCPRESRRFIAKPAATATDDARQPSTGIRFPPR